MQATRRRSRSTRSSQRRPRIILLCGPSRPKKSRLARVLRAELPRTSHIGTSPRAERRNRFPHFLISGASESLSKLLDVAKHRIQNGYDVLLAPRRDAPDVRDEIRRFAQQNHCGLKLVEFETSNARPSEETPDTLYVHTDRSIAPQIKRIVKKLQ